MTQTIPYSCRLCGAQHVARYDDAFVTEVTHWTAMLCCNRCADHHDHMESCRTRIANACREVVLHKDRESGIPPIIACAVREKLEKYSKHYARMLCDHLHLEYTWDPDFPESLFDGAGKFWLVLQTYEDGLRQIKRNNEPTDKQIGLI